MIFRSLAIVAIACLSMPDVARATPDATSAGAAAGMPSDAVGVPAYRRYVKDQADMLVGMTRVLAREIRDGNVEAAQAAYAPAHRYLARIEPVARILRDLHDRMDARADAYHGRETDPRFSGFHRIEYGLFAARSTAGLAGYADQLTADAKALRSRIALIDTSPSVMADAAARLVRRIADDKLAGAEERYSRTDLWDVEANIDGARQIVALLQQSQTAAPNRSILAATDARFARIAAWLEKHADGCGFKNFDEISPADTAALKESVSALADTLSSLRGTFAME